jgi:fucokinase
MPRKSETWDYLIVTAANERQGAAYELQMRLRREAGSIDPARTALVVADEEGKRIGSGGSTVECLLEVLRRESAGTPETAAEILGRLRILIVHAGGDSRRLPAYSPCGKIFVPLPGGDPAAPFLPTLFDRLIPAFLRLPPHQGGGRGQVVVASGDALLLFDPSEVCFPQPGITALGALCSPEEASRHGVLCAGREGTVSLYLQKPAIGEQRRRGAIGGGGLSVLDIGVMSMDACAAAGLLDALGTPPVKAAISAHGIDLYREICCALGTDATFPGFIAGVRAAGSRVGELALRDLFEHLHPVPFHLTTLSQCRFLHFGSTSQLIASGLELAQHDCGSPPRHGLLSLCNAIETGARIDGRESWAEGCRLRAPLRLEGRNVAVGIDVDQPFTLPPRACLDVSPGVDRAGRSVGFIRYYSVDDSFKQTMAEGATLCGLALREWLSETGLDPSDIWDGGLEEREQTLWNARVFPAAEEASGYRDWRWMLNVRSATQEQKRNLRAAERYSPAEIAVRMDHHAFHGRRAAIRSGLRP